MKQELAEHTGMTLSNNSEPYAKINNYLDVLKNNGLIDFEPVTVQDIHYLKLTKWSTDYYKQAKK